MSFIGNKYKIWYFFLFAILSNFMHSYKKLILRYSNIFSNIWKEFEIMIYIFLYEISQKNQYNWHIQMLILQEI